METEKPVDVKRSRFPFSIVWTPLPLITWFLPFIGHVGICTSDGVIYDFAGPYFVSVDNFAFGRPTKYWTLDAAKITSIISQSQDPEDEWDRCIEESAATYREMMYNFFTNNCHSFVARCLNMMGYNGHRHYNMLVVCFLLVLNGKFISVRHFLQTYAGFFFVYAILLCISLFS